jgi:uncharacterized protein (TIGR01777 family)
MRPRGFELETMCEPAHNGPMKVVIAGGSGFLGRALVRSLQQEGHHAVVLTRRVRGPLDVAWSPDGDRTWWPAVDGVDAVVNLAGESIAGARWTPARKAMIESSRVVPTRAMVEAMRAARTPPRVLLSGSAVGFYGARGNDPVDEQGPAGTDFLARVAEAWERAATSPPASTRVVLLRTGMVLDRNEGALPQLALPFRLFVGGPVGSGAQVMSWIHLDDWVSMVRWALATPDVTGPLNVTAPAPVTNREFAAALGRALGRPALLPTPGFALRLVLGEMADALILGGQRVEPRKAQALGFEFLYPRLDDALREIYRSG